MNVYQYILLAKMRRTNTKHLLLHFKGATAMWSFILLDSFFLGNLSVISEEAKCVFLGEFMNKSLTRRGIFQRFFIDISFSYTWK